MRRPFRCALTIELLEARCTPTASQLAPLVRIPSSAGINLNVNGSALVRGSIASSEVDYFMIVPRWTATYEIRANPAAGANLDPVAALYNFRGQRLALNDNATPAVKGSLLTVSMVAGQAYYVGVTNQKFDRGAYSISVQARLPDDVYDANNISNNTLAAASVLGDLVGVRSINGLTMADNSDWYKINIVQPFNRGASARLTTNAAQGRLIFELYGSSGASISTASGSDNMQSIDLSRLAAGSYFLKISGVRGSINPDYSLRLDAGLAPPPPPVVPLPEAPPPTPAGSTGSWTVLVYMTSGDLADFSNADINELETLAAGLPTGVRIGVFWDQWNQAPMATGNGTQTAWGSSGQALIVPDSNPNVVATRFDILGERNSGDPATLTSFLSWGRQVAPAEHTAIVLWNHGSGLGGSNYDSESGDHLTIMEATAAIATQGGWKPDILAYDACMMAMTENAYGLRQSANFLVASQENVDGSGFPYAQAFASLADSNILPAEVVRSMVAAYGSATAGSTESTMAGIRLSGMDALASALLAFTTQAAQSTATDLAVMRRILTASNVGMYTENAYRDLRGFMKELVSTDGASAELKSMARQVMTALENTIEARTTDSRTSGGLSIYLPRNPAEELADFQNHADFMTATGWAGFVNQIIGRSRNAPLGGAERDPGAGAGAGRSRTRGFDPKQLHVVHVIPVFSTPAVRQTTGDQTAATQPANAAKVSASDWAFVALMLSEENNSRQWLDS